MRKEGVKVNRSEFEKLFEPGEIGKMRLRNRLVMPAMGTGYSDGHGCVTERLKRYHHERAKGGVGLIITEVTAVELAERSPLSAADDRFIPGLRELTQVIHEGGARAALQLWHPGRLGRSSATGSQPVAPSPIPALGGEVPKELTVDEIQTLVGYFADAAVRAQKAGFDAVEIHGAHGYLVAQFLSPSCNQRGDAYGGSLQNRARFLLEIIEAIRGGVGSDYPMWCRINGQEYGIENGITIAETKQVAQMAQSAGVDAIHVSAFGTVSHGSASISVIPGILIPLAAEIKQAVEVPVIAVGRLDPRLGEEVLRQGKADFIAMGRRLLADAGLPNKVLSGRLDDINPCIACNECIDGVSPGPGVGCAVNPGLGTEYENKIEPVPRSRRVVVVGGGPAGMEAAIIASLRGHNVTLVERSSRLGGQLNLAVMPPDKEDLAEFIEHLTLQVQKADVRVRLDTEATLEYLTELNPDVAVFATGILPQKAEFLGAPGPNVVTAEDVLLDRVSVGQNVVVIGGGMVGCETAHYLADKGRKVTIVEQLDMIAPKMGRRARERLLNILAAKGVTMLPSARCEEIKAGELTITVKEKGQQSVSADTFVLATGFEPNASLFKEAEGKIPEIHLIGDASQPRNLGEALRDGFRIGHSID